MVLSMQVRVSNSSSPCIVNVNHGLIKPTESSNEAPSGPYQEEEEDNVQDHISWPIGTHQMPIAQREHMGWYNDNNV